ncbi:MAG: hypothetical protein FWF95_01540 [Syntrophorhabdaceae bacterium]|nr:hypothetical protein [Syntrophorhabdaceae bacterium]
MKKIPMTVLITTANNPPSGVPFLEMVNPNIRMIAAKAALYFWVTQGIEQIVLADATATNLLSEYEVAEIDKLHTRIEQISYKQAGEEIIERGKGYGEGKLIEYAINNSELLAHEESFFKCTGKVYVRNFPDIAEIIKANSISSLFWRYMGDGTEVKHWADCRFYYTSKNFAENHLIPAYLESHDINKVACENYVYKALEHNMRAGRGARPLITGYAGSTGEAYFDLSLGSLDNNFPCWVGYATNVIAEPALTSGDLEDARGALERHLMECPLDVDALIRHSDILFRLGSKEAALESLNKVLLFYPGHEEALRCKVAIENAALRRK